MEEALVRFSIGPLGRGKVAYRLPGEERGEHRAHTLDCHRHAGSCSGPAHGGRGSIRPSLCPLPHPRARQYLESGQPGSHRKRVARERACLIHRTGGSDVFHQLALSTKRRGRKPSPNYLAQAGEVRLDLVQDLRPLRVHPPPGHHLVEYQESPVSPGECPEPCKEPGYRRHNSHIARDRFHQYRGDVGTLAAEHGFGRREIVVWQYQRIRHGSGRDSRRVGQPQGGHAGSRGGQQRV